MFKTLNVAITGACGWLGGAVANHLESIGHAVFRIDKPSLSGKGVIGWNIRDDWKTAKQLPTELDAIFHFAAAADVNRINEEPMRAILDNVVGTARVLEWAKVIKPKQVNIISSMWVAAWPANTHPYTTSKVCVERIVSGWHKEFNVPTNILRLGTCYGPGGRGGTVITNFVNKAINNESLTVFGTGQASRYYLYIDDLVAACQKVLESECSDRWFDIAGENETTVMGIAELVKKIVRDVPIVMMPARAGDLDTEMETFGAEGLNWKPAVNIEDGIRRYFESLQVKVEKQEVRA